MLVLYVTLTQVDSGFANMQKMSLASDSDFEEHAFVGDL
jgi:hypothetical protein